jgi:hypothetical protein
MNSNLGNIWSNKSMNRNRTPNPNPNQNPNPNPNPKPKPNPNPKPNSKSNPFNNIFSSKTGKNSAHNALNSNNKIISGFSKLNNKNSKKYWGTPTWYLFHSIASRINEEYYKNNFKIVWQFIKEVCSHLPCPYCRSHALSYVNKIDDVQVDTKEKLIDILYNFHNYANRNSGSEQYPKEKLDVYKKANIQKMFNLFLSRFFKSYYGTRQFQDWNKSKFKVKLREFMAETNDHYDE